MRNMRFPSNHFDLIIDKSTIDALLCGDSSFMNTAIMMKVRALIKSIYHLGVPTYFEA